MGDDSSEALKSRSCAVTQKGMLWGVGFGVGQGSPPPKVTLWMISVACVLGGEAGGS